MSKTSKEVPVNTKSWGLLLDHAELFRNEHFRLSDLFTQQQSRFHSLSVQHEDLLLDFSKNYLTEGTLPLLLELANECNLPAAIEAMFDGEEINNSEQRAALHTALREPTSTSQPEVVASLEKMEQLVNAIQSGKWKGYSGKAIRNVVNIGIGGSDLGPAMVTEALAGFASDEVKIHFVSNLDPSHAESCLARLRPETTLFIISSKSFTTLETLQNAELARRWYLDNGGAEASIGQHFVASTANREAARKFGINEENIFLLWDWVGGRYSLWSAIGLPIAIAIGMNNFRQLLAGAHSMDQHFRHTQLKENIPVLMALLSVWYTGFFDVKSSAVVPYSQNLSLLPSYLQQLYMESLGKSVDREGQPISHNTAEVIWGTAGSNGQHSYFQLLHQGKNFIPVDFIALSKNPTTRSPGKSNDTESTQQHTHLLANCFSQSLALMEGSDGEGNAHKKIKGNKPSNTILLSQLNPYNLGKLIALYEHKVFTQSVIWNINPFDQWGVELGKNLSYRIFNAFSDENEASKLDDSTANLIHAAQRHSDSC